MDWIRTCPICCSSYRTSDCGCNTRLSGSTPMKKSPHRHHQRRQHHKFKQRSLTELKDLFAGPNIYQDEDGNFNIVIEAEPKPWSRGTYHLRHANPVAIPAPRQQL